MPLELRWWQECLFDGQVGRGVSWDSWAPVGTIYDAYEVWARKHTNRSLDKMEFGRRMAHLLSAEKSSVRRFRGQQHHAWNLRTLGEARKAFDVECASETTGPKRLSFRVSSVGHGVIKALMTA